MGTRVQSSVDFKIFDDRILSRYAARGLKGSATSSPTAGLAPDGSGTVKAPSLVSSNMIIHHETAESTSVPSLTTKDKANLARIRDNQRRSRQRRKEYLEELEARLRQCTLQETEYSFQVRRATERVADENQQLRMLLNRTGVGDVTIKNYLQGTVSSETIIGPARSLSPKLLPNPYPPGASTGKASPYSNADDTTSLEDGSAGSACGSDSTTSPSIELGLVLDPSKLSIFNQAMHRFWEFFNPKLNAGISWRAGGTEAHRSSSSFTGGRSFQQQALSQSTIRKHEHQDDEVDNLSDEGNRRPPKRPKSDFLSQVDGDTSLKFACPFRKHNPRKYNMHQYKSCALSSFESIARVKEHLYRKHRTPVQCIRCWLFFESQMALNVHLGVVNICQLRPGEPMEGVTPDMEKRLRSRKKASPDQTDEDRWREIYSMLFPDETVPSPLYEQVHDDVAQASETQNIPIEEFMRQQVPIIFRTRLEGAINDINIDEGQMLEGDHLHPTFVDSLTSMMEEAQENAIALYKSIIPSDDALSALITPAPSIAAVAPPPLQDRDRAALTISGFIGQDSFWSKSPQRPATVGRYAASNQEISSVTTPSCTKPSEHPQYSGYDPKATSFYDIQDADAPYGNQSQGMTLDEATVDKAFDSCCIGDSLWYTVQTDPGPIFSKSGTEDDNTTLTGTNNSFGWEGMG